MDGRIDEERKRERAGGDAGGYSTRNAVNEVDSENA
jgi:hypothetical protein